MTLHDPQAPWLQVSDLVKELGGPPELQAIGRAPHLFFGLGRKAFYLKATRKLKKHLTGEGGAGYI